MSKEATASREESFVERLRAPIVAEGFAFAAVPAAIAVLLALLGLPGLALGFAALAAFVLFFFRNPSRELPGGERTVVAPADGRVIEVGEVEDGAGRKGLRVGIFLSIFDVHVNRAPLSGRVVAIERRGARYRAAFDRRAEGENARLTLTLETARGERVRVVQIAGLVARRLVCHARVGDWLPRGARYGLIRFGSRTDVVLPPAAELLVARGDAVRGGHSVLARLEPEP